MSHVFISYASEDRARAEIVAEALKRQGWSVWSDREIPPGKTFDQVIEEALDAAGCVIVLWSKQSAASNWVKSEAAEGLRRGILVPALIDDVRIPLEFSRIQAARLVGWEGGSAHPEFGKLVKAVQTILGQPLRTEMGQISAEETTRDVTPVVEREKEHILAREQAPVRDELPVDAPRPKVTAGPFHRLSVREVLPWSVGVIGIALLAVTFWKLQRPDRAVQGVPAVYPPAGTALEEKVLEKQPPDRFIRETGAVKPVESALPTVSKVPPPEPAQPSVSKPPVTQPSVSKPPATQPTASKTPAPQTTRPKVASVPAPEVIPKDVRVGLSLDHTKIAFGVDRYGSLEIDVMSADGTNLRRMTDKLDKQPAWSPDGRRIAFVSNRDGNREIYVMNADGTNPRRLTNTPAREFDPAWSPDGRKIVFASDRDGNREIYVMNADGTNAIRLTSTPADEFEPAWSPDGAKIAFVSERDGNREIYVMTMQGTNPGRLTHTSSMEFEPAWSPDGAKIAFASERDGNREVYVMNADGSHPTRLTENPAFDGHPAWSPDGAKIAFASYREHNYDIYVMNANGTNPFRLTKTPWHEEHPSWSPFLK